MSDSTMFGGKPNSSRIVQVSVQICHELEGGQIVCSSDFFPKSSSFVRKKVFDADRRVFKHINIFAPKGIFSRTVRRIRYIP